MFACVIKLVYSYCVKISSATRYCRKGHFCDQFFTKFNDTTVCMIDKELERSLVAS